MVTIEEEAPIESNGNVSNTGDNENVNKSPMPEDVPKSFATFFNN